MRNTVEEKPLISKTHPTAVLLEVVLGVVLRCGEGATLRVCRPWRLERACRAPESFPRTSGIRL